jgi:hypothetical protein
MASVYGQHLYSENRYSWLTEWSFKPCEPEVWYKTGYAPSGLGARGLCPGGLVRGCLRAGAA